MKENMNSTVGTWHEQVKSAASEANQVLRLMKSTFSHHGQTKSHELSFQQSSGLAWNLLLHSGTHI